MLHRRPVLAVVVLCEAAEPSVDERVVPPVAYELAREVGQVNAVVDVLLREGAMEQVVMGVIDRRRDKNGVRPSGRPGHETDEWRYPGGGA